MTLMFLVIFGVVSTAALGQEGGYMTGTYISDPTLWDRFVSVAPDWLIVGVPFIVAVMVACRGLSEALLVVKDKTETNLDNKIYAVLNTVTGLLGKALGYIGVGMPKKMMVEKVDKAKEKEKAENDKTS